MKRCPYCAGMLQDAAIVCRYCGRDLPVIANESEKEQRQQIGEVHGISGEPMQENAPQKTSPFQGRRKASWVSIGGAILGITLLSGLLGCGSGGKGKLSQASISTESITPVSTKTAAATITSTATSTPAITPTPSLGVGSMWTRPYDNMIMMYIPAGEFLMGSEAGELNERPIHEIYLDAYWMDQTEVTNRMYVLCMDAGACEDPGSGKRASAEAYPDHPAVDLTWEMANTYCEWADARLPTEAEWEKAARGGLIGKKYPWGDEIPTCESGAANGAQRRECGWATTQVGSFSPNGYGLFDMAGNAWEWVADWYSDTYYSSSPSTNPLGPSSGTYRVLRGGSWEYQYNDVRSSIRFVYYPVDYSRLFEGIRCARGTSQ